MRRVGTASAGAARRARVARAERGLCPRLPGGADRRGGDPPAGEKVLDELDLLRKVAIPT